MYNHMEREELERRYTAALDAAAKQLSYRALSVKQLRDKLLEKGHTEDAVEYALEWLITRGMLNDKAFAQSVVRSYTRRGYGELRIRQELSHRGVPREVADVAMEEYEAEDATMCALLDKRLRGDLSDRKQVDKAVAALQRRGYRWDDIKRALAAYGASQTEEQYGAEYE